MSAETRHACITAVDQLAAFAARLSPEDVPARVRERLQTLLIDLFGVTAAGHRTPEMRALITAWKPGSGTVPLIGTESRTDPDTAALLNAAAACALELDEGNKHARGHPAVHVVFAALAAAQMAERTVTGHRFLTAVAAGYEVAARFGAAVERDPRWHTHGHWGATGAACAAALIQDASTAEVAAAIDSAAGLVHATPWEMVLDGNFTRNLWAGGANIAGLNAVRLARSGLVSNRGAAASTLGGIVGTLDPSSLTAGLGQDWLLDQGYSKRHASCSYTHAAVDLVQELRREHPFTAAEVTAVAVTTHSLARPLLGREVRNRLSAMFSLPFVVATAVLHEVVDPDTMDPESPGFEATRPFMDKVSVHVEPEFDERLPGERWARVRIALTDGTVLEQSQPNPRGDTDFEPLDRAQTVAKIRSLIGAEATARVVDAVRQLASDLEAPAALDSLHRFVPMNETAIGAAEDMTGDSVQSRAATLPESLDSVGHDGLA
ncbi:MmgE/PrpD family protein [Citricoccus sp.]|uniref:MmgE/PrpD family protein n=1 Tax=Citricoccus sp. TaxID=1978372 RepID=UPI0028BE1144|nr:MmgE/PrpD family protein [Citricoccus sp.]